jgi:hypothetical protein
MKSYERGPKESEQAWQAFTTYLDVGIEQSLLRVAKRCAKSLPLMKRWSAKYTWADQAKAYDTALDRLKQTAEQKGMAKATEKAAFKREIAAQRVLEETANVAFSKITDVIKWENEDGLVDSADLPDEVAAAIESVEIMANENGERKVKLKFHSKLPALTKLGENKKLWNTKDDTTAANNFYAVFLKGVMSGALQREIARREAEMRVLAGLHAAVMLSSMRRRCV